MHLTGVETFQLPTREQVLYLGLNGLIGTVSYFRDEISSYGSISVAKQKNGHVTFKLCSFRMVHFSPNF